MKKIKDNMLNLKQQCRETTLASFGYDASDDIAIVMRANDSEFCPIDWQMVDHLMEKYGDKIDANYELEWEDGDLDINVSPEIYREVRNSREYVLSALRLKR